MNAVYLLCGLSFAGKSTLANHIRRHRPCSVISLDAINAKRGLAFGGYGISAVEWDKTRRIACAILHRFLRRGATVLVDDTNCFRWIREGYRRIASRHGCRCRVLWLDVPRAEIERRRQLNASAPTRPSIDDTVLHQLATTFEWPDADEDVLRFRPGDEVNVWLRRHFGGA